MRLILAAALAASVLLPVATRAQDTAGVEVRPGSTLLDASRIAARTDTFAMRMEFGPIQLVIRTAPLGDTALLRVERMSFEGREIGADSFAVRRSGLAPLFAESRGIMGTSRLTFPPGRAEGTYTPPDREERIIAETLSEPLFYANSMDLVLASLPLAAGRSFDLATWTPGGLNGVISVRVPRAEEVQIADGSRCDAWRVETVEETGRSPVYWIERSTGALLGYSADDTEIRIARLAACRR
jgi:hypothetical protein